MEDKLKHLEFVQNIITRMNTNSFQIKSWMVTIVSALLAVFASTKTTSFILIAMFPVVVFWFLDAYYLTQERKFRGLYTDIAGVSKQPKKLKPFEMRPDLYTEKQYTYCNVLFSITLRCLYIPILFLLLGIYIYLSCIA